MSSINYNLDKGAVIKLFEVTKKSGQLAEKYEGHLGWFFDAEKDSIIPPKGITGMYPTRGETYLEMQYNPAVISEEEVKKYLLSLGVEVGKIEEYKMTLPKLVLKWLLAPFAFVSALIILGVLKLKGKLDDKGRTN